MNTSTRLYDFLAPSVPSADADGLLKITDLNNPIRVDITLWDGIRPGYYIQLLLNGKPTGPIWTMTDSNRPGDTISLALDHQELGLEAEYRLNYRATNHLSQIEDYSSVIPLIVDRTAPGASLLAPVIFSDINFGPTLSGKVPGYAGMAVGDTLQTLCNEALGPICVVQPDHLTVLPIEVVFDRDFLESLGSETISVSYQVTDRAGNSSILAPGVELTLQG